MSHEGPGVNGDTHYEEATPPPSECHHHQAGRAEISSLVSHNSTTSRTRKLQARIGMEDIPPQLLHKRYQVLRELLRSLARRGVGRTKARCGTTNGHDSRTSEYSPPPGVGWDGLGTLLNQVIASSVDVVGQPREKKKNNTRTQIATTQTVRFVTCVPSSPFKRHGTKSGGRRGSTLSRRRLSTSSSEQSKVQCLRGRINEITDS